MWLQTGSVNDPVSASAVPGAAWLANAGHGAVHWMMVYWMIVYRMIVYWMIV